MDLFLYDNDPMHAFKVQNCLKDNHVKGKV